MSPLLPDPQREQHQQAFYSELLIRIDERLKTIHSDFNEYKVETAARLSKLEERIENHKDDIRDFKTGFSVISAVAFIGATFIFQWEQIKAFFSGKS